MLLASILGEVFFVEDFLVFLGGTLVEEREGARALRLGGIMLAGELQVG